jgi:hypothetical protein
VTLGVLVTLGSGPSCGRLREKQAVRRYALAVRRVEAEAERARALAPALDRHRGASDTAALRAFLKGRYLPRLRALVSAVRSLPAEGDRLRALKTPLLGLAERALEAGETLADRVGGGPLEAAWSRLDDTRKALEAALRAHGTALDRACREHDLRRSGS